MSDISVDEAYSYFKEHCHIPDNYDLQVSVFEYHPEKEKDDRFQEVFNGFFPYPRVFPFKDAHMFGRFMLTTTGNITDENGNIFKADKGKYYTFVLIYKYYTKKKTRLKWRRIDVFNA